ncbi:15021_t:CDS:2 [Acaulospora colombiana]|uniref:15021_t:CDS:1 n=1 Tax=Acaulospora colombiana TaxID=27376 RepID=A0ACA9LPP9_9GLOM|nr:15021_t:CDS:2 [Acaulospora colombiana]
MRKYRSGRPRYSSEQLEHVIRPQEGELERRYFDKTRYKPREAIKSPITYESNARHPNTSNDSGHDLNPEKDLKSKRGPRFGGSRDLISHGNRFSSSYDDESSVRTDILEDRWNNRGRDTGQHEGDKIGKDDGRRKDESENVRLSSSDRRAFEYKNKLAGHRVFVSPDYFDDASVVVKDESVKVSKLSKLPLWKRIRKYRIGGIKNDKSNLDLFEEDFTEWLKTLRLAKYSILFKKMSKRKILKLTDAKLESLQITLGARRKLLKELARINETRQAEKRKAQGEEKKGMGLEGTIEKQGKSEGENETAGDSGRLNNPVSA